MNIDLCIIPLRIIPLRIIPILIGILVLSGCSFGQQNQQQEAAPLQLDSYESPSSRVAEETATDAESNRGTQAGNSSSQQATGADQEQSVATNVAAGADSRQSILLSLQTSYNGEIEPDETVTIMAEVSGQVLEVLVDEGDQVVVGQELVHIDGGILEAQQAQAVAGLKAAQAQLDLILVAADPENVEAAEASANAAAVAYREAADGASDEDLTIAQSQVRQAEAAVRVAQAGYNEVKGNPKISMMPQSQQLEQATLGLEAAQAQYQKVLNGAPDDAIAGAYAGLVQARTQLANLQEGAKPEQIRAVEAQIEQAEAGLYLATLQVAKTSITAPMDGIIVSKNVAVGSMAAPGAPVMVIMSHDVNITIPVEENRMAQLALGQPAVIQVNAYPGQIFEGEVVRIAPQLDTSTRTVRVTIRPLDDSQNRLVPGMFAKVDLLN